MNGEPCERTQSFRLCRTECACFSVNYTKRPQCLLTISDGERTEEERRDRGETEGVDEERRCDSPYYRRL